MADRLRDGQQLAFVAPGQHLFQLEALVKVVFDGGFAAAGDDDRLGEPGGGTLLHAVLNEGLIHQREHLFRDGFGGGKEAGAESRSGEDSFSKGCARHLLSVYLWLRGAKWLR